MFTARQRREFREAADVVAGTGRGRESSMYGPLRDMFALALGYERRSIDIDRRGARGRPDITVFASGATEAQSVPWIVLEAKDERDAVTAPERRSTLFAEKAKYITADTAWFVMVDPEMLVARPVERGTDSGGDIEIAMAGVDIDGFAERLAPLAADRAGIPPLLERFRAGDESLIATERLSGSGDPVVRRIATDAFFDGLRETTRLLQNAVEGALSATRPRRLAVASEIASFRELYGETRFTPYPVRIEGSPQGREATMAHGRDAHVLSRRLAQNPALARLALDALPRFAERVGLDPAKSDEALRIERFFAIETANLLLARILLIRFLEDHGFFDESTPDGTVRRRYLCNGGVAAFQGMRAYFSHSYMRLIEEAYRSGATHYAAAFNETELDWVLALGSPELSRTVEWAMYRFSRYDFTTIRGDLLTGVYDRFLDPGQRKAKGEFYTPPSIARWMLDRLGLESGDSVIDPACGSGTFLIERYQQAVGEDADRGLASYEDALAAVARIAGNDINPFSAVLTQIQLLWHLLAFGAAVHAEELPALPIAERANSLVPTVLKDQSTTRFGEIDRDDYSAVVGNPPYVRPERGLELDPAARDYYDSTREADGGRQGISADRNVYRLFIYRALDHWCANPPNGKTGKLAFVLPLGFCSGADSADLRRLFMPGGRWTIREIVDMELIWKDVFDGTRVLPMIFIAEARPPAEDDRVTIHLADETGVSEPALKGGRPSFDLDRCASSEIGYPDLFSSDGRILTRLTPRRLEIVRKLRRCGRLEDAAMRYWTRRRAGGQDVALERPAGIGEARWEEQRLIKYGLAKRGKGILAEGGMPLWKGENLRAGSLAGSSAFPHIDVEAVDSSSVWAYSHILPGRMFALPRIEQIPCATPFDPHSNAMDNTVIVFAPRADLSELPFDALLVGRVYGYYVLLELRASYQDMLRSDLYPSVISALPWSEALAAQGGALADARARLFEACRRRFEAGASMRSEAESLGLAPLRDVFRKLAPGGTLVQSEAIAEGQSFPVGEVEVAAGAEGWTVLPDSANPDASLTVPTEELAALVAAGLRLAAGTEINRTALLRLPVPPDSETAEALAGLIARYATDALEEAVEAEVDSIDAIVGPALGLSSEDIAFIQHEMATDPFLGRVRPRYPYFTPKQRGRRRSLERSARYRS
ncbi:MAG TPA: N-6 DNA methylase [Allosphingosinicella sp.]|jgi:hypothetical protein